MGVNTGTSTNKTFIKYPPSRVGINSRPRDQGPGTRGPKESSVFTDLITPY